MIMIEDLRLWLIEQVAELCELTEDEVDIHRPLDEYGLSSRSAVQLSGALEELLDRPLSTTLLWEHPTIESLATALIAETSDEPVIKATANIAVNTATDTAADIAIELNEKALRDET